MPGSLAAEPVEVGYAFSAEEGEEKGREEGDSEYSPWLGMEHYHDTTTGENYGSVRAATGTKQVRKGRAITLRSVTMSESWSPDCHSE